VLDCRPSCFGPRPSFEEACDRAILVAQDQAVGPTGRPTAMSAQRAGAQPVVSCWVIWPVLMSMSDRTSSV